MVNLITVPTTQLAVAYQKRYEMSGLSTNRCGIGHIPSNIIYQNLSSEIHGDDNAINTLGLETGGHMIKPIVERGILNVLIEVTCPEGFDSPAPEDFNIHVVDNNPNPKSFVGSAMGTRVSLEPSIIR